MHLYIYITTMGKKKKSRKRSKKKAEEPEIQFIKVIDDKPKRTDDIDLTLDVHTPYLKLLDHAYKIIEKVQQKKSKKFVCPKPIIPYDRNAKKTNWVNWIKTAEALKRDRIHLKNFLLTEFTTSGNMDENNSLVIVGRYYINSFQDSLTKYIIKYVRCDQCGCMNTNMTKDQRTRQNVITCKSAICGAERMVK